VRNVKCTSLRWLGAAFLVTAEGFAGTTGSLEGYVRARDSKDPLVGAHVLIVGTSMGTTADIAGAYRVSNIPAGVYDVRGSFVGCQTVIVRGVMVKPDLKSKLDFDLTPAPVEVAPVVVTAERPPIQKDVTGTVYSASSDIFTALPVQNVGEVVGLQPGVTLENNIRGGKTTENLYLVDGLPIQNLMGGGAGASIPQSSISELAIHTGGFDPEYGNALSGVINLVTKRGTENHIFNVRCETDRIFGIEQTDRRYEIDAAASGPVAGSLYYIASLNLLYTDTRWWQDMEKFFSSPVSRSYNAFGKLEYGPTADFRISGQFLYSYRDWRDYEYSWRFNLAGLPPRNDQGYRIALILSHTLSTSLFYTASLSLYALNSHIGGGSSADVDTAMYQWDFFLRYIMTGNRSWWADKQQSTSLAKLDVTWRASEHHLVKAGGDLDLQGITSTVVRYEPQTNVFGKPFVNKPMLNYGSDYRYFPRSGSLYVQDKLELSKDGMLLNLGVRYEFLDPRAERPLAERVPLPDGQYQTSIVGTTPASIKQMVSPRIGFAAPFAARGYLFINYGVYYQWPLFDYLYSGLNNVSLKKGVGVLVGNPDLKPEKTRSWELSIKYALANGVVLSGTYFNKETTNLIDVKTFVPTNSSVAGDYGFAEFVNNPYARVNGLELSVMKEEGHPLSGSVSYTLMFAEGLSQDATAGMQYYQWGLPVPAVPFPLSWDQRHTVKATATLELPWQMLVSGVWSYHTGRPYTYYPSTDGFTPLDPTMEFEPNNARMADYNMLDVKISKTFSVGDDASPSVRITVYADGKNILNSRNVLWVDSSGKPGGELGDVSAWDSPRRVRVGLRVAF